MQKFIKDIESFEENRFKKGKFYKFTFTSKDEGDQICILLTPDLMGGFSLTEENNVGLFFCSSVREGKKGFIPEYSSYSFIGPDSKIYFVDDEFFDSYYFRYVSIEEI